MLFGISSINFLLKRYSTLLVFGFVVALSAPAKSMYISHEDAVRYAKQAGQVASYIDATVSYSVQGAADAVTYPDLPTNAPGIPKKVNFDAWTPVTLPLSSGASCGNGSPYTFYLLKRSLPRSFWDKMLGRDPVSEQDLTVMFEGGGACNDFNSCKGGDAYGAVNANGLANNYIGESNPRFSTRQFIDIDGYGSSGNGISNQLYSSFAGTYWADNEHLQTKDASQIFLPYCSGDLHIGSKIAVYKSVDNGAARTQFHSGLQNVLVALKVAKKLLPETAGNLVVAGFSAGGVAATLNYPFVREIFKNARTGSLISDSGPVFSAPFSYVASDSTYKKAKPGWTVFGDYPAAHVYRGFLSSWGLAEPAGLLVKLRKSLAGFTAGDMGSIYAGIKGKYTKDKVALLAFLNDSFFPVFVYEKFMPALDTRGMNPRVPSFDPEATPEKFELRALERLAQIQKLWQEDLLNLGTEFGRHGYSRYYPLSRNFFSSHCVTTGDFSGTRIFADWYDVMGRQPRVPNDQVYKNAGIFIQRFLNDPVGAPGRFAVATVESTYNPGGLSTYMNIAILYSSLFDKNSNPSFYNLPSVNLEDYYPEWNRDRANQAWVW